MASTRQIVKNVEDDDYDVTAAQRSSAFRYHDKPGVVGVVEILGDASINIGGMQVSRDDSEHALIVLTVDSPIPADLLDLTDNIGAHSGRFDLIS